MSAIVQAAIRQSLTEYLPTKIGTTQIDTVGSRLMMLVIQKQEDPEERRYQVVKRTESTAIENIVGPKTAKGPARSLWQFEQGGGIKGVLHHKITGPLIDGICDRFEISNSTVSCWQAVEENDVLAACFARLLLWTDALKMPGISDAEGAFQLYLRTWRPGAYTRGDASQRQALQVKFLKNHAAARLEMNIQ